MKYFYIMGFPPFDWIGEKIINGIASFFFTILLLINTAIYSFISYIYNIFLLLAGGGAIFDRSQISDMVSRIYVILGVVVLFLVAYSLLKSIINPDESLKGKKSPVHIIKDVIISVVLIALVPSIFEFAFEFQNSLLIENTIGKIIAGNKTGNNDSKDTIREGGYNMAEGVWQAFIYVNPDGDKDGNVLCANAVEEQNLKTEDGLDCKKVMIDGETSFAGLWEKARANTTFTNMILLVPKIISGEVSYIFLLDTIAGAFVLFVLISYCLDMALRLVKLAVYELLAPIPILSRIIPNEQASKVFNNWVKACLSTFAEVFIRIAILYFAVMIISTVGSSLTRIFGSGFLNFADSKSLFLTQSIAKALVIVGIILFVKQAPEIIKEITGLDAGKYNVFGSAMRGLGVTGALGTGLVKSFNTAENNDNHPIKSFGNKWVAPLYRGLKSGFNAANKDYKKPSDIKSNAHDAVEDVISKQRKRQAAQLAKDQDYESYKKNMEQGPQEPDFVYRARQAHPKVGKFFHDRKVEIADWAGAGEFDTAKLTRTKEMADKVKSGFDTMEGAWNKKKAYSDTQSKLKEAESVLKAMERDAAAGKDVEKEYGITLEQARQNANNAKAAFSGYVRSERAQKADLIVQAAREMQLTAAQYSDVKLNQEKIITRTGTAADHQAVRDAIAKYGDLSIDKNLELFEHDLRSDDDAEYASAKAFIEYFDNMKKEAQEVKGNAVYQEQAKGGSAKKKEEK